MADNQRNNPNEGNRPGQDQDQGRNQDMINNPSGETRGKNPAGYNPDSPTGQNVPGRDPERNNDPNKNIPTEVPDRGEKHETKIPKAEDEQTRTYGDFDEKDDAASQ
jgi:hypothetical protein